MLYYSNGGNWVIGKGSTLISTAPPCNRLFRFMPNFTSTLTAVFVLNVGTIYTTPTFNLGTTLTFTMNVSITLTCMLNMGTTQLKAFSH